MLEKTKINYSQKKLFGKLHTSNTKEWYEELNAPSIINHSKFIWVDEISNIPDSMVSKLYSQITMVEDITVSGRMSYGIPKNIKNDFAGFIPPTYGIGYSVKIFIDGEIIPTSHYSKPFFDYVNGVLVFENIPPKGIVTIDAYTYIGLTLNTLLEQEQSSIIKGEMGFDEPKSEYIIQHNLGSMYIDLILYYQEQIDDYSVWKKDQIPFILLDENRLKIELSVKSPIKFIIKLY